MRLGVVLTDERCVTEATTLLRAAHERGWTTRCFLTDRGVLALDNAEFRAAATADPAGVAVCELSVERFGGDLRPDVLAEPIVIGGQYQNAELVHTSDRVVVY